MAKLFHHGKWRDPRPDSYLLRPFSGTESEREFQELFFVYCDHPECRRDVLAWRPWGRDGSKPNRLQIIKTKKEQRWLIHKETSLVMVFTKTSANEKPTKGEPVAGEYTLKACKDTSGVYQYILKITEGGSRIPLASGKGIEVGCDG